MYKNRKVLDIHSHVSAPMHGTPALAMMMASNTALNLDPRTSKDPQMGNTDEQWKDTVGKHIALLDSYNIDAQLLGPRPFLMLGWMKKHLLPVWCRYVNNMIYRQVQMYPTRFVGAAQLPQDPDAEDLSACVPEIDRCVNELGFKGVYLSPDPSGDRRSPGMHTKYWDPVYKKCQDLGIPIIVHGTNCGDERISIIPHNYQIGFVVEQYIATQLLSHGDVFQRFPNLKVVICHCGGALDRFVKTDPHLSQRDLSKNLFFDTNAPELNFLEAAIKQRGASQMCFGTEAPGSGRHVRPETGKPGDDLVPIIGNFPFLNEEQKMAIFHDNAVKVCPGLGALGK